MCGERMAMINQVPQEMLNICGPAEPGLAGVWGEGWGSKLSIAG